MGKYNAGIATQENIVNAAKIVFYEKGYEKATIKEICAEAKVLRTVFTYYFKDKAEIADHISNYLNIKIMNSLHAEIIKRNEKSDDLLFAVYMSSWFFYNIMCDENLNRFYAEMLSNNFKILLGDRYYRKLFSDLFKYCGKDFHSKEFELFFTYSTSPPGIFLYHYLTKTSDLTKEEIVEYLGRRVLSGLSISTELQDKIMAEAFRLLHNSKVSFKKLFFEPYTIQDYERLMTKYL